MNTLAPVVPSTTSSTAPRSPHSVPFLHRPPERNETAPTMAQTLQSLQATVARLRRQCDTVHREARASGSPERQRDALHLQARIQALHQCIRDVETVLDRLDGDA